MTNYSAGEISAILKTWDKDEDEYRNKSGKKFLSQSDVGSLLHDPKSFRDRSDAPLLAFLHGSYYHEAILEPHKVKDYQIVDASTRSTKLYKEALTASGKDILLLKHEKEHLDNLIDSTLENKLVRSLIQAKGNVVEKPGIVKLFGEWFKGRADIISPSRNSIIDLKTTTEVGTKFKYKSKTYNYDAQAYIYSEMFGMEFIFIACDKNNGNLGIFECSDAFLSSGELKVERAVENYRKYYKGKTAEETRELLSNRIIHEQLF